MTQIGDAAQISDKTITTPFVHYLPAGIFLVLLGFTAAHPSDACAQTAGTQTRAASPCSTIEAYKQLDFWVGEWDVEDQGKRISTSSIQRIVGSCVIFENHSMQNGYHGKSFNFYDAVLGRWRQTCVDSFGNVSEFVVEFKDGAMHLKGESHHPNGVTILRTMVLSAVEADSVPQYSERSVDGGKTWQLADDYIYTRR